MSHSLIYKIDKAVKQKSNPNEIEKACVEYLAKFPKNIRVLNILNNVRLDQNKQTSLKSKVLIKEYITSKQFQKAYDLAIQLIQSDQNDPELYAITGDVLKASHNFEEALNFYKKSTEIDINYERVNSKLYNFLMTTEPSSYIGNWASGFQLLLSNKQDMGDKKINLIGTKALKYIKLAPFFKKLESYFEENFLNPLSQNSYDHKELSDLKEDILDLSNSKLFLLCIENCKVTEIQIEKLLIFIRKFILFNQNDIKFITTINNLIETLAINSFFNNYLLNITEEENESLFQIENEIIINKSKIKPEIILKTLTLGMYKNLSGIPFIKNLSISKSYSKYFELCISNPLQENKLAQSINSFGNIENNISLKVKEQYENYPYPQWIYSSTYGQRIDLKNYMSSLGLRFYNHHKFLHKRNSILIAGCGTGKEPAEYGQLIKDVDITAVDLSSKSLGYAIRKCNELKIDNINFLQGDILNLELLNQKFNFILSNGVIHHMEDPNKGFETLNNCLNKDGFLKLSLYSKTARRNLVKFQEIAKLEKIYSHSQLLEFRNKIIKNKHFENESIKDFGDFYNSSTFKDLVLHEQEHTFTINKIKEVIKNLNLKFCGFQNIGDLHKRFIIYFRSSKNLYDLDCWEEFEEKFPDTFPNMYQFWCQKV